MSVRATRVLIGVSPDASVAMNKSSRKIVHAIGQDSGTVPDIVYERAM